MSRALLAIALLGFLVGPFRWGWTRTETDFPNYYTAARLALDHQPLRNFYDWTWFQRRMNYAGIERQLGAYVPHTPLTLAPMLPLAGLSAQHAKQVWLLLNLLFMTGSIWLLANLTGIRSAYVSLLLFAGFGALALNFMLGQYYVFLLFLLSLAAWLLFNRREFAAGVVLGTIFAFKLYTAPFLLYFVVKKRWSAALGMVAAVLGWAILAVAWFGWSDNWFYLTGVLPRALDGTFTDPYHPGLSSMTALLRRTFVFEPELNPLPLRSLPLAFYSLRSLYTLALLVFTLLAIGLYRKSDSRREFALIVTLAFVLSPEVVFYQYVLLLVPVVLVLPGLRPGWMIALVAFYVFAGSGLGPSMNALFPKLWLLLAFFFILGWEYFRRVPFKLAAVAASLVLLVSGANAAREMAALRVDPSMRNRMVQVEPNAIFSSAPAVSDLGVIYQSIGDQRYILRRGAQRYVFDGHAFHPATGASGTPVYFEFVSHGHSSIARFTPPGAGLETVVEPELNPVNPAVSRDGQLLAFVSRDDLYIQQGTNRRSVASGPFLSEPAFLPDGQQIAYVAGPPASSRIFAVSLSSGKSRRLSDGPGAHRQPAISPDGRLLAFRLTQNGLSQVWVQDLTSGIRSQVTAGNCNNDSPAWQPDSKHLVFASDCGRGYGLPGLYELEIQ